MKKLCCCLTFLALGGTAFADDKAAAPAAGMPDMSKMGPMSRPVTKEDKKGVDELFKASEAAWKAGDINAAADLMDFPIIMLSDDSTGKVQHFNATREQWMELMKPMFANMPKDIKFKHKHNAHFLSDTLAIAINETTMDMGKTKGKWKGFSVLTNVGGKWKYKQVAEAGWGDTKPPGATAAARK